MDTLFEHQLPPPVLSLHSPDASAPVAYWNRTDCESIQQDCRTDQSLIRKFWQCTRIARRRIPEGKSYHRMQLQRELTMVQHTKKGRTCVLPDSSGKTEVVPPMSQVHRLLEQPNNILSTSGYRYNTPDGDCSFTHPRTNATSISLTYTCRDGSVR